MRSFTIHLAVATSLAGSAVATSGGGISAATFLAQLQQTNECGANCITTTFSKDSNAKAACSLTDVGCCCTNSKFYLPVAKCIQDQCGSASTKIAQKVADLCKQNGSPYTGPTSSTSLPSSSPTQTSKASTQQGSNGGATVSSTPKSSSSVAVAAQNIPSVQPSGASTGPSDVNSGPPAPSPVSGSSSPSSDKSNQLSAESVNNAANYGSGSTYGSTPNNPFDTPNGEHGPGPVSLPSSFASSASTASPEMESPPPVSSSPSVPYPMGQNATTSSCPTSPAVGAVTPPAESMSTPADDYSTPPYTGPSTSLPDAESGMQSSYTTPTDASSPQQQDPTMAATPATYDGGVAGLGLSASSFTLGSGLLALGVALIY